MLQVTSNAALTIAGVRDQQGMPETMGIRITAGPASNSDSAASFQLGFVEEPMAGDQVTETEGTRVFVAPEVADVLSNATLDFAEESGRLILTEQQTT
jgi:Fe-S cluster assembly iron-binding protein IscA